MYLNFKTFSSHKILREFFKRSFTMLECKTDSTIFTPELTYPLVSQESPQSGVYFVVVSQLSLLWFRISTFVRFFRVLGRYQGLVAYTDSTSLFHFRERQLRHCYSLPRSRRIDDRASLSHKLFISLALPKISSWNFFIVRTLILYLFTILRSLLKKQIKLARLAAPLPFISFLILRDILYYYVSTLPKNNYMFRFPRVALDSNYSTQFSNI